MSRRTGGTPVLQVYNLYMSIRSVTVLVPLIAGSLAAQQSFTLEQVTGAPFPDNLVASPTGGKVGWQLNARGARNLWVAAPPDYRGRQVTSYTEDDGQAIDQVQWTPDGQSLIYVRGGDFDMGRDIPNPRSYIAGAEQVIWMVSSEGGAARRLVEGHSPAVSPKGDRVAFIQKDQIWMAALEGGEKPTQAVHARGKAESLRWSPDGTKLAFVSSRGDHSFIGVFEPSSNALRYLDPGVDRDLEPVWSADSQKVAFIRAPASYVTFGRQRTGEPWSIRIADVKTGRGQLVWKAEQGRGSVFHGIVARDQLMWAGKRLVFPWERSGWVHLYSLEVTGASTLGTPLDLTPGEFEVEHVTLTPTGRELVYSSNQADIDRRHLWKIAADHLGATPITSGEGIEWSPVVTSDGKAIAFLRSGAQQPARPAITVESAAPKDLAPDAIPADFPADKLVMPQAVMISAADGMQIHGQLFVPVTMRAGERRPAVVFFHGGSRRQMLLGWHYMYYYNNAYAMNQYLASRGFIVLSVNYRSGIGYGLDFREALNYGARGASEFNDVVGAGLYLRGRPDVNPARIGLWGGSYGGYLTALGLARASDLFAAGVDFHGVHDWNEVIGNFTPSYDPQKQQDDARIAFESSPMAAVKQWRSPVLLIHGDDDRNVPFTETVMLVEALRKQNVQFEELIFPDEVHDFLMHAHWLAAYHASEDFLKRHLMK
ncbi:MAG TPA: prolyl oligopeptidase family serine peptidase [Bryobacteraceae bacterium]|nr:prolyl oligopeptidase family serine peptidase [Bryobacteraceae bacterium]